MIGRRAIVSLCMLCALAVSALAAQSAGAATKGTTAFTCAKVTPAAGTAGFSKEHCTPSDAVSTNAAFEHVAINENTTTHITVTNEKTNAATNGPTSAVFKSTAAGAEFQLVATGVHGEGGLENKKEGPGDPNPGEHYIHVHELTLTFTGVTESLLKCEVFTHNEAGSGEKGVIHTEPLTITSTGQGDSLKITPKTGTVFASFTLKGCAIEGTYKVVGSLTCKPNGATINCSHEEVTTQGTLKLGSAFGPKAGYAGSVTVTGSHKEEGVGTTKPLSVTTVETP